MELCYPCDMEAVQQHFEGAEGVFGWNLVLIVAHILLLPLLLMFCRSYCSYASFPSTKVDVSVKCRPPCKACEVNSPILSGEVSHHHSA
eukprot:1159295-Pelagomonas_calceolata.AAC.11